MSDEPQAAPTVSKRPWYKICSLRTAKLLTALLLPVFLETLDYTVVATAQTHIASAFNHLDLQSYIGTIYLLTSAAFLPVYATIADVFGRHWALQTALLFFLIGSTISTAAQNMPMMLAGRGIAGIGAAGLLTVIRIILADAASLEANNKNTVVFFFLYGVGYAVGPSIGGALTSVSFRWVFAINLPCAVLSMFLCFVLLRGEVKGPQPSRKLNNAAEDIEIHETIVSRLGRIDWIGITLFVVGSILLLLGLNWGGSKGWDRPEVISCLVVGAVILISSLLWEYVLEQKQLQLSSSQSYSSSKTSSRIFSPDPMIPFELMKNYDVVATEFASFTAGMVMLVIFYFISIFMVIVSGKDATQAGVQLIFFAPGLGVGSMIAIRMIKWCKQPKYPIIFGSTVIPIALGLLSMAIDHNSNAQLDGFMAMTGVGVGASFGPLSIQAQYSQPKERVAIVTSLNIFFRTLGGTVGLAQCGTVLNAKVRSYFESLTPSQLAGLDGVSLSPEGLSSIQSIADLPPNIQALVKDAYRNGVKWCFISLIPWAGLAFIGTLFLTKLTNTNRDDSKQGEELEAAKASPPSEEEVKKLSAEKLTEKTV